METAFAGPKKIADRIGDVDADRIADHDPDEFAVLCAKTPAVHRFPGSMAKRIQELSRIVVDEYNGDAAAVWLRGDPDGREVYSASFAFPGSVSRRRVSSWRCWVNSMA